MAAESRVEITAIKALLFYEATGRFSKDVLSEPNFTLWNTTIGEGSAEGASNSTLVLVEIAGPAGKSSGYDRVVFNALYKRHETGRGGKIFSENVRVQQTASVGWFSDLGRSHVGFWLHDTGCVPVQILVTLNSDKNQKHQAIIPFKCGE
jgi:hypothetical protein